MDERPARGDRARERCIVRMDRRQREQVAVRPPRRVVAVVRLAQREDERARVVALRDRPVALLVRQEATQHRREAVQVATPVQLLRRHEVAVAARLERAQQARRLVVVVLLPTEGQ